MKKFGADLKIDGNRVEGHIIITDTSFIWKPIFSGLTRKLTGLDTIEIPIEDVVGYQKGMLSLTLGFAGMSNDLISFYTWKGQSIIDEIKKRNPSFRMYSSEEIVTQRNWNEILIWIVIIAGILIYHFVFNS